jgi:6-pyruvoyltetrahydropterin/6-carboxytetrahydropterin synthase
MRITATRRLQYAIGHRVFRHESKCRHLHGHNFVFFLTAESTVADGAAGLDVQGRVIDFGSLKEKLGSWLERAWDHGVVLFSEDGEAVAAVRMVSGQKVFLLPWNPTAENLGRYLLEVVGPQVLPRTVRLTKVVVWETENGIATVEEGE